MSIQKKSTTPVDFEKVLNQLYSSRPTKLASLMANTSIPGAAGNMGPSLHSANANFLAPNKLTSPITPIRNPVEQANSLPMQDTTMSQGDSKESLNSLRVDPQQGSGPMLGAPAQIKAGSVKTAMTEQELLAYYGSGGDVLGMPDSDSPTLNPQQALSLTALGAAGVGANRLRTRNMSNRQLKGIRDAYMSAVEAGNLDSATLKNLNKELKLRGSIGNLTKAPTLGIADANLLKAEKNLAQKLTRARYGKVLPILATTLLGTTLYNKLQD